MRAIIPALIIASFLAMAGDVSALSCLSDNCVSGSWTDVYNPRDIQVNMWESISYTHVIRDDGFDIGKDLVLSALLTVDLDNGSRKAKALIDLPGLLADSNYNFTYEDKTIGVSVLGLLQLNLLGELSVSIHSLWGSFYFDQSTLVANGLECSPVPEPGVPVPEPGTFALLGSGLFAFAFAIFFKRRYAR